MCPLNGEVTSRLPLLNSDDGLSRDDGVPTVALPPYGLIDRDRTEPVDAGPPPVRDVWMNFGPMSDGRRS